MSSPITLPPVQLPVVTPYNAAQAIYGLNKQFSPYRKWAIEPLATSQKLIEEAYDLFKPQIESVLEDLPEGDSRKMGFIDAISSQNQARLSKLPSPLKPLIDKLVALRAAAFPESQRREKVVTNQVRPYLPFVKNHIRDVQFNQALLQMDPDSVALAHPKNVRVVAPVGQNYGSTGPHGMTGPHDLTLGNKAWQRALQKTASMDEAVSHYLNWSVIPADADPAVPDSGLQVVAPVATRRSNPYAWRKADNTNPNVRRIAVFIDDAEENMKDQTDGLMKNFIKQPWNAFNAQSGFSGYRVDEILIVRPPTAEESKRGITVYDKLTHAFAQMHAFTEDQRKQARAQGQDPKALSFESYISWAVHGSSELPKHLELQEKQTGQTCPERFREGSMEFRALFKPLVPENHKENVSETTLKHLEHQYLSNFRYVVQHLTSCTSGSFTA